MFQHIDAYAGDPILSLMEEFSKDTRQNKVNLSIGLYYNEDNIVPQLQSVQKAYTHLIPDYDKVRVYLPMDGLKSFNQAAQELISVRLALPVSKGVSSPFRLWVVLVHSKWGQTF